MYSDFYEIPLPALRFEKVEETDTKVNNTEENNAFQIRPRQKNTRDVRNDRRRSAKKSKFTRKKRHAKELKRFQNNADRKRTSTSAFPEKRQTGSRRNKTTPAKDL